MSASTEFAASLPFFSYRQRNAVIDNFFYDTASLTLEEKAKLDDLASLLDEMLAETGGPLSAKERKAADRALGR